MPDLQEDAKHEVDEAGSNANLTYAIWVTLQTWHPVSVEEELP